MDASRVEERESGATDPVAGVGASAALPDAFPPWRSPAIVEKPIAPATPPSISAHTRLRTEQLGMT
jgi:hypothetical protein